VSQRKVDSLYTKLYRAENKWTNLIMIDVPRTFSSTLHIHPSAMRSLGNVLNAYANLNPEVGYCQGMNFLIGLLLRVLIAQEGEVTREREEDVFWMFVCLMDFDGLRDFYREGFPLLLKYTKAFYDMFESECPDLFEHFEKEGISPSLFLHQWFLSLFVNCLPFQTVLILWDNIICDGLPVILTCSISLLKVIKGVLLKMDFEGIINFFKSMKHAEGDSDTKTIGVLLAKQAALISIPREIMKHLHSPTPPPSPPPVRHSPWTEPIFPIVFDDATAESSTGSLSLFARVSSAFAWSATGLSDGEGP
jgi:hypothetical protein